MNKITIFAVGVLVLGILGGAYMAGFLDFLNPDSFVEYKSERYGYTLEYPRSWTVDDSQSKARLDLIHSLDKKGVVLIQVFEHESYKTEEGRVAAAANMRKDFESRPEYKLDYFNSETKNSEVVFEAAGLYRDANGVWNFIQRGRFMADGKAYNIVARMLTGSVDTLKPIMTQIIDSFNI